MFISIHVAIIISQALQKKQVYTIQQRVRFNITEILILCLSVENIFWNQYLFTKKPCPHLVLDLTVAVSIMFRCIELYS